VSNNTSAFTAGRYPLYQITTDVTGVTDYLDLRLMPRPRTTGLLQLALSDVNTTLTRAQADNDILQFTGTLTAQRNIVVPLSPKQWSVFNNSSQGLQFIGATGTGIVVATTKRAIVYADGTNVVRLVADI
jgi:hypothetical protein